MSDTLLSRDLPAGRRSALVIATGVYTDPELAALRAPAHDAADLTAVLGDRRIGGFEVTTLTDRAAHEIRVGVQDFLADRIVGDLLVVYVSCHGVRDAPGRLYFAAADTRKTHLASTGIESGWLLERLDECRARQQVLILDCCFSGAFAASGTKGDDEERLRRQLAGHGRGRVVLTASRATEYSFEGQALPGAGIGGSVFTAGLVQGLRTGEADHDNDGLVSVEDAYDYAYTYVQAHTEAQTPQRWTYGAEGTIWLARNPTGRPMPLPAAGREAEVRAQQSAAERRQATESTERLQALQSHIEQATPIARAAAADLPAQGEEPGAPLLTAPAPTASGPVLPPRNTGTWGPLASPDESGKGKPTTSSPASPGHGMSSAHEERYRRALADAGYIVPVWRNAAATVLGPPFAALLLSLSWLFGAHGIHLFGTHVGVLNIVLPFVLVVLLPRAQAWMILPSPSERQGGWSAWRARWKWANPYGYAVFTGTTVLTALGWEVSMVASALFHWLDSAGAAHFGGLDNLARAVVELATGRWP